MLPNCQGCVGSTASMSPSSMDMTGRNTLLLWNVSYFRKQFAFLNIQNMSKHSSFFPFRALQSCECVNIIPPTWRRLWNIWFTDVSLGWCQTWSCCSQIKSLHVIQVKMDFAKGWSGQHVPLLYSFPLQNRVPMSKFPVTLDYACSQTMLSVSGRGPVDPGQQHMKDCPNNLIALNSMFWSLGLGPDTLIY